MKKVFIVSSVLLSIIVVYLYLTTDKNSIKIVNKNGSSVARISNTQNKEIKAVKSIFVPYWSLGNGVEIDSQYDEILYFGVTAAKTGINTEDSGYLNLSNFREHIGTEKNTLLVLRMLDNNTNFEILKDKNKQNILIAETIILAKKYNFKGVVLDLEVSALPFDSLIKQITSFTKDLSNAARIENLSCGMTIYGDNYYRVRPYDVKTLSQSVDKLYIMAYDFSKAGGNPGPNFPLKGQEKYGYDYEKLTDSLLSEVQSEKISFTFGLFGYDWQVDEKNISQKIGQARSLSEIEKQVINNCTELKCSINKDSLSGETKINYTDEDGLKHVMWYEDLQSVENKQNYLKSRGITNFSYWAYSYF